jgi:hypothetical protein
MPQTIAQNLLSNRRSLNRDTNYGKHPIAVFTDLDESIKSNETYVEIDKLLTQTEQILQAQEDQLNAQINQARDTANFLFNQYTILQNTPAYSYDSDYYLYNITPNITTIRDLTDQINELIYECTSGLAELDKKVGTNYRYLNQVAVDITGSNDLSVVTKQSLINYIFNKPLLPKVVVLDSTLKCNSSGIVVWDPN